MANPPRSIPCIRMTIPVPLEAHKAFQVLADALGRTLSSVIGEWLLDQAPAAISMGEQIAHMKGRSADFTVEVVALTDAVQEATRTVLELAKSRTEAPGGTRPRGVSGASKKALTPPSSNTGGKVIKISRKAPKGRP